MRVVGFLQVRNEVESGHIERFLKMNLELFDALYAFDDSSDDETPDLLEAAGAVVLRSKENNFQNETENKIKLLGAIKNAEVEGTAIVWLDADEVIYATRAELEDLISHAFQSGFDSISLNHLNLWKSKSHYRLDDGFNSLKPVRVWKLHPGLRFSSTPGLHSQTHPEGLIATKHHDVFPVVHYGFASYELILSKYANYYLHWQRGYALERLVSEKSLDLRRVDSYPYALGSRWSTKEETASLMPEKASPFQVRLDALAAKLEALKNSTSEVTVVCLIYKSTSWLEFAYRQMLKLSRQFPKGSVELLFVANDPSEEVVDFLKDNFVPHVVHRGRKDPDEWYINSVYRAYNFGVSQVKTPYAYLINSDMAFHSQALRSIMRVASDSALVASRLIELGRLPSGQYGVEKDFGKNPKSFRENDFQKYAERLRRNKVVDGGLFMPLLVNVDTFSRLGGFPEGNILEEDLDKYISNKTFRIAQKGAQLVPGDQAFMLRAESLGVKHQTMFDSIAYHFQEGELRDKKNRRPPSGVLIANDLITGINGEETLWNRIASKFSQSSELDPVTLEGEISQGKLQSLLSPVKLFLRASIRGRRAKPRIFFANASFQIPLRIGLINAVLLQDRPKRFPWKMLQKIQLVASDRVFTNDLEFFESNIKRRVSWFVIRPNSLLTETYKKNKTGEPLNGIFVGAFNATKGIRLLEEVIRANPEIKWTVVTKYEEDLLPPGLTRENVTAKSMLDQRDLFDLIRDSDFLIGTSPWETQHLASIEALILGTPVFITPTGVLGYKATGEHDWGLVSSEDTFLDNFAKFVSNFDSYDTIPFARQCLSLFEEELWLDLEEELQRSFLLESKRSELRRTMGRINSLIALSIRSFARNHLIPFAMQARRVISR